ncbi:MAG: hypothetical protein ACK5NC_11915 [Vibrio sp.]
MAAIKKSVRLVDETIKLCHELTVSGDVNWSGAINTMAEQYKILINESLPELTGNQKHAFYCVFNGYIPHPSIEQEIQSLYWHLSEGYQYDEQVRDLLGAEEEAISFINTVKGWSKSQKLAVIYMARAYWRQGPIVSE